MSQVYLALGSNQQNPLKQLQCACESLHNNPNIILQKRSNIYATKAIGPKQPNFLNMAVLIQTTLTPHALLLLLKQLERQQGRVNTVPWGPRTLDLDILFFDDLMIQDDQLQIPHPRLYERDFVLVPLQEIYPIPLIFDESQITKSIIRTIPCSRTLPMT